MSGHTHINVCEVGRYHHVAGAGVCIDDSARNSTAGGCCCKAYLVPHTRTVHRLAKRVLASPACENPHTEGVSRANRVAFQSPTSVHVTSAGSIEAENHNHKTVRGGYNDVCSRARSEMSRHLDLK